MSTDLRQQMYNELNLKETEDLLEIWTCYRFANRVNLLSSKSVVSNPANPHGNGIQKPKSKLSQEQTWMVVEI